MTIVELIEKYWIYIAAILGYVFAIWQFKSKRNFDKKEKLKSNRRTLYLEILGILSSIKQFRINHKINLSPIEIETRIDQFKTNINESQKVFQSDSVRAMVEFFNLAQKDKNMSRYSANSPKMTSYLKSEKFIKKYQYLLNKIKPKDSASDDEVIEFISLLSKEFEKIAEIAPRFKYDYKQLSITFTELIDKMVKIPNVKIDSSKSVRKNLDNLINQMIEYVDSFKAAKNSKQLKSLAVKIFDRIDRIEMEMARELNK